MAHPVSAADRFAIEDILGRYFLAIDTGDVAAVVAQFTPDGAVRYADGSTYEGPDGLRRFAERAIGGDEARGRMHIGRTLFAQRIGDDILLRSYLMVPQAVGGEPGVTIATLRYIEDRFRQTGAGWRIGERAIFPWTDDTRTHARAGLETE